MGDLIAIIGIICAVGLPIATGLIIGLTAVKNDHKQRMGLINQGIIPPDKTKVKSNPNRLVSLRNGIVLISVGMGIIVGFLCSEYLTIGFGNEFWMLGASVVFFLGIGYLTFYIVTQKIPNSSENEENGQL